MGAEERKKRQRTETKVSDLKGKKAILPLKRNASTYCNFKGDRRCVSKIEKILSSRDLINGSVLQYLQKATYGTITKSQIANMRKGCIINQVSRFKLLKSVNQFQRRVTSVTWHPVHSQIAAAASKGGEMLWFNLNVSNSKFTPGIGPGGSIVGLKFSKDDPCLVYTVSITGCLKEVDVNRNTDKTLLSTSTVVDWFSSLDICYNRKYIMVGDTLGFVSLITDDGMKVWCPRKKLHKSKVTHVEFSLADPNIFVTASTDHTVKLWDFRMLSENVLKPEPVLKFPHEKGVNSAYFSPSNGQSLLTTDQHSEIRIYKSPYWTEELIIRHPHRQFQHLTPVKATWHPIEDIVLVGRYPDDNYMMRDERTIDFYDGSTGNLLLRKMSPTNLISSVNAFNITGDAIISGAGTSVAFWKEENVLQDYKF